MHFFTVVYADLYIGTSLCDQLYQVHGTNGDQWTTLGGYTKILYLVSPILFFNAQY